MVTNARAISCAPAVTIAGTATHVIVGENPRPRTSRLRSAGGSLTMIQKCGIDDCVLALLLLGRHDGQRVWKSFDWAAMERLHEKGLISDPVGRAKSVVLTDEGLEKAERLFRNLFETNP